MMENVRSLALKALLKIEKQQKANDVIDEILNRNTLNDADRRLFTELVYGISRWKGQIDWIINKYVKHKPDQNTFNILRLGVYQLIYLDKVPSYAAINETVELVRSKKKTGFVNAVLRKIQRNISKTLRFPTLGDNPVKHISIKYSFPEWLIERWLKQFGLDWTISFCSASNQNTPISIRTNTLRIDQDGLIKVLQEKNIQVEKSKFVPEGLKLLDSSSALINLDKDIKGLFQLQDESAMLVAHILDPKPGDVIFDVCAGPGGKATHIAQLMKDYGQLFAFDILQSKIDLVNQNSNRLGISIIKTGIADASKPDELLSMKADRILLDVPCSGLGTLRRHTDIRWNRTPKQISELSELQLNILNNSSKYLKPDGVLVYSTCTIEPEENESVVEEFLKINTEFELEPIDKYLPCEIDNLTTKQGYLKTYPHLHDIDGSFVARLKKKSTETIPQVALLLSSVSFYDKTNALFAPYGGEYNAIKGVLHALLESHYSVDVLAEHQIEDIISEYPVIVLPEVHKLNPEFKDKLLEYVKQGGNLLLIGAESANLFEDSLGVKFDGEPVNQNTYILSDNMMGGLSGIWQKVTPEKAQPIGWRFPTFDPRKNGEVAATVLDLGKGKIAAIYGPLGAVNLKCHTPQIRNFLQEVPFPAWWDETYECPYAPE